MSRFLAKIILFLYLLQSICNADSKIEDIVREVFANNLTHNIQILQGGLSSPGVYKLKNNGKEYVLRLSHPNRPVFERNRTIQCYELAAQNGIAPSIKYANADKGVIVSEYINSNYLSKKDLLSNDLLIKLAETIKTLHDIDHFPLSKDIFTIRQSFEKKALLLNSVIVSNAVNYLKVIDNLVQDESRLVPTHNDLKPENIMFNKKFMIVDWEAACQGYPCFDLATVVVFYNLSESEENKFLEAYYGRKVSLQEKERINLFKQEVLGYYGMAYLMLSVNKKLPILSFEEVENLPELSEYLANKLTGNNILNSYSEAQKLGWILIKKLNKNLNNSNFSFFNHE